MINKIIYPEELLEWIDNQKDFQLIDLTDENLLEKLKILSTWIPVHHLFDRISEIEKEKPVVLSCRVGADSFFCMNILAKEYNMENVFSLKSGAIGLEELLKTQ